jgi:hypothetical protein
MCIYPIPSPPTTSIKSNVIIDTHVHNTQNVEIIFLTQKQPQLVISFWNFFDNYQKNKI